MSGNMFQITNQVNIEAARVAYRAVFMQQLGLMEADPLEILFQTVPSTTSIEEMQWLGDMPGFSEWKGDRELGDVSAFKLQIANRDWSSGFRVHQNQFKDDKIGLFPVSTQGLASEAKQHRFDLMMRIMLNGFTGTAFPDTGNGLAYDGAFLFSDSHSSDGGPPQSNKLTGPLTRANLVAAELKLKKMRTYNGKRPLRMRGTHLIVGPMLEDVANTLMSAELLQNASGTAADTNTLRNKYKVIVSSWVDGPQWFLSDLSRPFRPFIFQLREEISTSAVLGEQGGNNDSINRFMRGEYLFGAEARYNLAAFAWQTIIGSQG